MDGATSRPRLRFLAPLALLLLSTIATLAAVEIGLRMTGLVHRVEVATSPVWSWVADDPVIARTNRASAVDDVLGVRIDTLGFRGGEVAVPKPWGSFRIVCLGDSTTFGIWRHTALQMRGYTS